jgi:hypothetical protein
MIGQAAPYVIRSNNPTSCRKSLDEISKVETPSWIAVDQKHNRAPALIHVMQFMPRRKSQISGGERIEISKWKFPIHRELPLDA